MQLHIHNCSRLAVPPPEPDVIDERAFDRSTFTVVTAGTTFLRGTAVDIDVPDFPTPGRTSRFVWNEGTQHLELVEVYAQQPPAPDTTGDLSQFAFLVDYGGKIKQN